jgi:hypothetical protein
MLEDTFTGTELVSQGVLEGLGGVTDDDGFSYSDYN